MRAEELTIEELKSLIGYTVEEKLQELLGDPDAGLELRPEVRQRLERSLEQSKTASNVPIEEVVKRLGSYADGLSS